jgi:pimeloyl-ACP methyl ester carboxylesterase
MQRSSPQSFRFTVRGCLRALVLPVLAVYALVIVTLYFAQRPMVLHAPIFQTGIFPFEVPATLKKTDWTPGGQYAGIVIEPRNPSPKATIVFYHGNNGTAESVGARGIGSAMALNGYRVVMVEYPGFGRRPGNVSFDGVLEGSQAAFQAARKEFNGPLILAGESYGAAMAAQVANRQGGAAQAVMLFVPWDSLLNVAQETLPYVPVRYLLQREYNSIDALAHFHKPVLVAAAEYDELIPPHHGQALAKALPSAQYVMLKGVRHNWWYQAVDMPRWAEFLKFASGDSSTVQ